MIQRFRFDKEYVIKIDSSTFIGALQTLVSEISALENIPPLCILLFGPHKIESLSSLFESEGVIRIELIKSVLSQHICDFYWSLVQCKELGDHIPGIEFLNRAELHSPLFVRPIFKQMYLSICSMDSATICSSMGMGKSMFAVYFIMKRLQESREETIIYAFRKKICVLHYSGCFVLENLHFIPEFWNLKWVLKKDSLFQLNQRVLSFCSGFKTNAFILPSWSENEVIAHGRVINPDNMSSILARFEKFGGNPWFLFTQSSLSHDLFDSALELYALKKDVESKDLIMNFGPDGSFDFCSDYARREYIKKHPQITKEVFFEYSRMNLNLFKELLHIIFENFNVELNCFDFAGNQKIIQFNANDYQRLNNGTTDAFCGDFHLVFTLIPSKTDEKTIFVVPESVNFPIKINDKITFINNDFFNKLN